MFDRLVLKNFGSRTTAWGFQPLSTPGGRTFSVGRTFFYPKTYGRLLITPDFLEAKWVKREGRIPKKSDK